MRLIAKHDEGDLAYPVTWHVYGNGFHKITYARHVRRFLDDVQAATEYGLCVRHAAECAGKLDYRRE